MVHINDLYYMIDLAVLDYRRRFPDDEAFVDDFRKGFDIEVGRKYIKILNKGAAWAFIVKADDDKFKAGDVLKPASYAAPARNAARGNVIDKHFPALRWTGPAYLN